MVLKEAINIFNRIRNLPFHISIEGEVGCDCEDKSKMLVDNFKSVNLDARLRVGIFKWSTLNLPETISNIPHEDECSHFFVEFKNQKGEWVSIDPTWNPELKKAGFPIAIWDGEKSTELAVTCNHFFSPQESEEYPKHINYSEDLRVNGKFYAAFNIYCDSFLLKGAK